MSESVSWHMIGVKIQGHEARLDEKRVSKSAQFVLQEVVLERLGGE
jgi:hypothetical protein